MLTSHCHPERSEGSHNVKRSFVTDVPQDDMLKGEIVSKEVIDTIFNSLEKDLLDRNETSLDFKDVGFISVYFLEKLEQFVVRAKDLNVKVEIKNVQPNIYKVLQIARVRSVLEICN